MGKYASTCLQIMRQAKVSARKYPPSSIEIAVSLTVVYYTQPFIISLPPSLPPSLPHSLTHSLTPSLPPSLPPSLHPSLTHSLPPSLPSSLPPSLTHSLPPSLPPPLPPPPPPPPPGCPQSQPPHLQVLFPGRKGEGYGRECLSYCQRGGKDGGSIGRAGKGGRWGYECREGG